ncbi:hypothetical protein LXL04_017887 [Taraxacum kok-saghyz]
MPVKLERRRPCEYKEINDGDCSSHSWTVVVLDLDETLVCAYETASLPDSIRKQATDAGLTWFELECIASKKEYEGKPKVNYVIVFERPGLHEFLAQLSKFADLVLFTASLEGFLLTTLLFSRTSDTEFRI